MSVILRSSKMSVILRSGATKDLLSIIGSRSFTAFRMTR